MEVDVAINCRSEPVKEGDGARGGSFEFIDREGLYAKRSIKDQFDVRPESR